MAYEIVGETIKSAISVKLGKLFDNPYRYKENITKQKYPNFHIVQVEMNVTPKGLSTTSALNSKRNRIQLDYLMNIQYRIAEDTETISNLQQQLDDIGIKLLTNFTELDLERPTKVKDAYYEKADGILQFFFNITVFALPVLDDEIVMNALDSDVELNKEED